MKRCLNHGLNGLKDDTDYPSPNEREAIKSGQSKKGLNHGLNGLKDDTDYSLSEKSEAIKSVQSNNPRKSVIQTSYKQTEVGVIPEEWEMKSLGELGHFKNGINKGKEDFGHGFPLVNLMDVFAVPKISTEVKFGLVNSSVVERNLYELRCGDVLFVRSSVKPEGIGLTTLIPKDLPETVFSGFLIRYRDNGQLALEFKEHCFFESGFRGRLIANSTVSANTNINQDSLKALQIAFPPDKEEQRAIAAALSDVDALLAKLDQLIAKKRNLKQAAMQQLLTGQTRLPGFSGEWEVKRLSELLEYEQPTKYLVKDSEYSDENDVPVLTAGKTFILGYTNEENGIFNNLPAIIFDDFTTANKYVTFPFKAKSSAMKILKPRDATVNLRLVFEVMQLIKFQLGDHKRYWISEYQNLEIKIPNAEEQTAIAAVLSDMDAEIAALEARRDKTRALKQGMMQELLTGRIRLV